MPCPPSSPCRAALAASFLLLILGALWSQAPRCAAAQEVALGGTVQARFGYGRWAGEGDAQQRLGFGIRRARLRAAALLTDHVGGYLQLDAGGTSVTLLDSYAFYERGPWRVQLGRFAVAQPRAAQMTSHTRIDAIERAVIGQEWEARTLGNGGRDFGLEAQYAAGALALHVALHNGNGTWDRAAGNFRASVDDPTGGAERTGMAASLYGAYAPPSIDGLEVGGYVGYNGAGNAATEVQGGPLAGTPRTYLSYSAHAYWGARPGSQPLRLKADLIAIDYEALDTPNPLLTPGSSQEAYGVSLLGAARVHRAGEVFARGEYFDPSGRASDDDSYYFTAGASFSLSALRGEAYRNQRLTLAYQTRRQDGADAAPHLLILQAQIVF